MAASGAHAPNSSSSPVTLNCWPNSHLLCRTNFTLTTFVPWIQVKVLEHYAFNVALCKVIKMEVSLGNTCIVFLCILLQTIETKHTISKVVAIIASQKKSKKLHTTARLAFDEKYNNYTCTYSQPLSKYEKYRISLCSALMNIPGYLNWSSVQLEVELSLKTSELGTMQ